MARFEPEAKVLATFNHPNIAAIYGLEQAEGKRFIAMELVEGTLAQRRSKGCLPVSLRHKYAGHWVEEHDQEQRDQYDRIRLAVARETECPYLALFPYGSTITEGPDSPFAGNSSPFLQTTTEYG